jgi:hypothetical protein
MSESQRPERAVATQYRLARVLGVLAVAAEYGAAINFVSVLIVIPLIASIAVVPHAALIFQPLFQGAVVLAIGLVCLACANGDAPARGDSFHQIAMRIPVE